MAQIAASTIQARLRRIQGALGVRRDGMLGPETLSALEAHFELAPKASQTGLQCSISGLEQIVKFEVSSKAYYEKYLQHPTWPGEQSGVTIGIGYDIGVTGKQQIEQDWRSEIPDEQVDDLLIAQGTTGPAARILAQRLSTVTIPLAVAERVFYRKTLPVEARDTRSVYPGVQALPADAQAMLLSLVYNRGTSMSGPRRAEMAALRPLVRSGTDLEAIAGQFESMERLWPKAKGLRDRRRREAEIIRASDRQYSRDEVIAV